MNPDQGTSDVAARPNGHPGTEALDLQQFCGTDECRYYLMKPFSRDGFTWATDGAILVRVALRPEIPEIEQKIAVSKPLEGVETAAFVKPKFNLPLAPTEIGDCPTCRGRGYLHDCPDCECDCERCNATGTMDKEALISTKIGGKFFSLKYVRQILALPRVEIEVIPSSEPLKRPIFFRFDGGVGALMPLDKPRETHVEIEPSENPGTLPAHG